VHPVERNDAVGFITINRPTRFNSMDVETARDFRKAGCSSRATTISES
jgi:enoyl-CoA hydratase/carnithine racemase